MSNSKVSKNLKNQIKQIWTQIEGEYCEGCDNLDCVSGAIRVMVGKMTWGVKPESIDVAAVEELNSHIAKFGEDKTAEFVALAVEIKAW